MSEIGLIIELGSQHTLQIQRMLRELGHASAVLPPEEAREWLKKNKPRYVIGSGGYNSVYDASAPRIPHEALADRSGTPRPYLGICFGMQDIAYRNGALVERGQPEYARTIVEIDGSPLFAGLGSEQEVWMSHGDSVKRLGAGFRVIAKSKATGIIAAIAHDNGKHFGVQFHPEVSHTKNGKMILKNFAEGVAGCLPSENGDSPVEAIRSKLLAEIGGAKAILGFSGGVDSTTLAKIANVLGDRLLGICIDGGHLRECEADEIERHARAAGIRLKLVDASDEMITAIGLTTDSEEKRAAFRRVYERIFCREALEFGGGGKVFVLQATLASDRIESGHTGGAKIKTHHNVGLSFDNLPQLHPLGGLYKDEVRTLARNLGLPKSVFARPPFPGPGNFLRVVTAPVSREALSVAQWAEARVREILSRSRNFRGVSQLVVAVLGKATGVKGDAPVYGYIVGVRAVRTKDFMTAEGVEFSGPMQRRIKIRLGEHPLITQVGFFPTDKPPGTTEFE